MSDGLDSLLLRFIRSLDTKFDRMAQDIQNMTGLAGELKEGHANVSRRLDLLERRFEHIERQLELVDAQTPRTKWPAAIP